MKKKEVNTKKAKIEKVKKQSAFGIRQTAPAIICLIAIRVIFELILRYDNEK